MNVYTDGSCSVNPGPGGYGVVVLDDNDSNIIYDFHAHSKETTNNIQELKALIHAFFLASLRPNDFFNIYADSAYAIGVFTQWAHNWERNNWTKSDNKPIKNLELIKKGYSIYKTLKNCRIIKVAGHNDNIGNELADALATNNIIKYNKYKEKLEKGL